MLAVNRKTLKPSNQLFNRFVNQLSATSRWYLTYRIGYWAMGWTMKSEHPESIKNRRVGFFFEDNCYGIFIDMDC